MHVSKSWLLRRSHKLAFWGCLVVVGAICAVCYYATKNVPNSVPKNVSQKMPTQYAYATSLRTNAAFFGNTYWGRSINQWSQASPLKEAYPFSRLNEFGWNSFDASIAGLECPTVAGLELTPAQEEATLQFNCSPNYLPEAKKWFTAFMLANNHTDNQGAKGFAETKQHLEENGIQYFGHYDPEMHEDVCEMIALPTKIELSDGSHEEGKLPVALCGYHGVFKIPSPSSLAVMQQYKDHVPVIAMTHMGTEYRTITDSTRTVSYHSMIDNGADMVLGDHPHWVQPTEIYNGHFIIYGMGNFIFDQQSNREVTRSAGVQVIFEAQTTDKNMLKKWLDIGKICGVYHDDCLDRIKAAGLKKLPFTYQIGIIGVDTSNKITHPADATVMEGILERVQWKANKMQLQAPYSAIK